VSKNSILSSFFYTDSYIPNFGSTTATVWVTFSLVNKTGSDLYLQIANPILDSVIVYTLNDKGKILGRQAFSENLTSSSPSIKQNNYLIDLETSANAAYTYLLEIRSDVEEIQLPIKVGSLSSFLVVARQNYILEGLLFGFILFLVIYHLFQFSIIRESAHLYFALFTFCIGLIVFVIRGYDFTFIVRSHPALSDYIIPTAALAGIFAILFTASFLKTRVTTPKRHIWLLALVGLYLVIIVLHFVFGGAVSLNLLQYNCVTTLLFLMFVAVSMLSKGFKPAKYYLFALSFFVTGFIIYLMRINGLVSTNLFTSNVLLISVAFTILFLAFAMGKMIDLYIEKRNEAQVAALQTAMEKERLIANQNRLLEIKVMEKTRDLGHTIKTLQKQSEELKGANQFKDKVFSVISHDLKSPVATLTGLLSLLRNESLSRQERDKAIDTIDNALRNTRILLDNILTWANRNGNGEDSTAEFKPYDIVQVVFELFEQQAEHKTIKLTNNVNKNAVIHSEPNTVQLVLRNLVSNAIKFTKEKGEIAVGMEYIGRDVEIYVKDNGVGMDQASLAKLFQDNLHYTTRGTQNEKGTGLGLMLCKEFIEKIGGSIRVTSQLKRGSTFRIILRGAMV
jgi:signal transduction histidine kinase